MKRIFVSLALGFMLATVVAVWTVGCSSESKPAPRPVKTLTYTDNLVEGGPGYVDVYEQTMTVTSNSTTSSSSGSSSTTTPTTSALKPAIIVIHGGAWRSGARWQVGPVANEFAQNGYVAFAPDYSLAPRAKWSAQLKDLQTLLRYIRTNSSTLGVDPKRIGAWGGSAGGHLATMLALHDDPVLTSSTTTSSSGSGTSGSSGSSSCSGMSGSGSGSSTTTSSGGQTTTTSTPPPLEEVVVTSGRVRCTVDAFGPADLTIPDGMAPDEDGILRDFLGAPRLQLSTSELLDASTINYARPDASVLILHGTSDSFVSIDHSEHLFKALTNAKADVDFIRVYGGLHDFSTYHAPEAWGRTLQFFDTRLKF